VKNGQGVSLVVILWLKPTFPSDADHHFLRGVALTSPVPLYSPDRNALVGDLLLLKKSGQGCQQAAVDVRRVDTLVTTDFLEHNHLGGLGEDLLD